MALSITMIVLLMTHCLSLLTGIDAKHELPEGVTEEGYCVACETMASHIFKRLSDPDTRARSDRIEEILRNLCSTGYFKEVIEFQPRDMVKACKHIFKGHKKQITSSIESVLSSTGTLAELRTAMCHMSSPACREVRKPANINSNVNTITDDNTLDAIEAYVKAHKGEFKRPRIVKKDEL